MHRFMRLCKQYPTEVHDPHQCNQFLNSMMQVHGPESDTGMFLVVDMHISYYFDALVYRSPKHSEYYGDYQTIMRRVKTSTMTMDNFLPRLYHLITGNIELDEVMLLRSNEIEVDTCQIHMIKNSRYVGMFPDSDGDNEDWNILNLISWFV